MLASVQKIDLMLLQVMLFSKAHMLLKKLSYIRMNIRILVIII